MNSKIVALLALSMVFMLAMVIVIPSLVSAGTSPSPTPTTGSGLTTPPEYTGLAKGTAQDTIKAVTNWVLGITGAVAILFIIYGGFRYITASGNQTNMEAAKNILIKAIIGLVIVVVAYVIVTAIFAAFK
jgi:hypothetical protein